MSAPLPLDRLREAMRAWSTFDAGTLRIEPIPPGATADVFLLSQHERRWVAKYVYDERDYVTAGLAVSRWLDGRLPYDVAAPLEASDGELTTTVEWPAGHDHPLAVLRYVDGSVVDDTDDVPELIGDVCGRVHAALLDADPTVLGITQPSDPVPTITDDWDLGEHGWLDEIYLRLTALVAEVDDDVRHVVGVWDGPDVRVDERGRIGLIDFGHTGWHAVPYVVMSRSLGARMCESRESFERFVARVQTHLPLTATELGALDLYRLVNATIYARWAVSHPSPTTTPWAAELLRFLGGDLPRVGLRAG